MLIVLAIWEVRQLAAHRHDVQQKVLTTGLVLLAIIATVAIPAAALRPIKHFFGPAWSPLVNGCWMAMAYTYSAYFVLVHPSDTRPAPAGIRRSRRDFTLLLVAVATQSLVTVTAPPGTWHHPRQPEDYFTWRHIVFTLSVDGYALAVWFVGATRALRYRSHLTYPWMRAAISLVIAGPAAMAISVDGLSLITPITVVFVGHRPASFSVLYSIGQLGGQALLACGLLLIPTAGAAIGLLRRVDRAIQRRYARKLRSLWQLLCAEFPYIELSQSQPNVAFEHVVNEISDGLAELSRYAPPACGDTTNPQVAATVITDALRSLRKESTLGAISTPPYPRIEPELGGWRPRARWMLHVGRELDKRGILPRKGPLNDERSAPASPLGSGHGSHHAAIERAHGAA
ncbi:DUF6545 domain-containing protein [Nocardia sp. NPDC019255]|uniref:DUF6545 domain-containing protein n=1 Tax=Nocardia sp. NPDC019255 TaxID=3154591 RepID=UPI0033C7E121